MEANKQEPRFITIPMEVVHYYGVDGEQKKMNGQNEMRRSLGENYTVYHSASSRQYMMYMYYVCIRCTYISNAVPTYTTGTLRFF